MAQVVKHLPSMHKALTAIPSIAKKRNRNKKSYRDEWS
jgi:hypothetical protein